MPDALKWIYHEYVGILGMSVSVLLAAGQYLRSNFQKVFLVA